MRRIPTQKTKTSTKNLEGSELGKLELFLPENSSVLIRSLRKRKLSCARKQAGDSTSLLSGEGVRASVPLKGRGHILLPSEREKSQGIVLQGASLVPHSW